MTRDLKIGIMGGLTSSALFLYFIDPIVHFLLHAIGAIFSGFSNWFYDRICAHAALGTVQDSALLILTMAFSAIVGILFGITILSVEQKIRRINDEKHSELKHGWQLRAAFFLSFIMTLSVGYSVTQIWLSAQIITSFHQHLDALAPAVTEAQLSQWRSKWAQMESHNDYEKIYQEMSVEAKKSNIKLLKNPVYSMSSY